MTAELYSFPVSDEDAPEALPSWDGPDDEGTAALSMRRTRCNLTDLGNAERLVSSHGPDLRYCESFGRWFVWDGSRFAPDDTGEVMRRASATARLILAEAMEEEDSAARKRAAGWAMRSESSSSLRSMVSLATFQPGIPVRPEELDSDPWVLTVRNGTVDLRTQKLHVSTREHLATKMSQVRYEPGATCPTWVSFLNRIFDGDAELIAFVQRAVGYSLTGSTREQVMFIPHGNGSNGKTTFLEILQDLLGDFSMQTPPETLMARHNDGGVPNDIAMLKGARLVCTVETEDGKSFSEATVKRITGGDTVSARFMRAEWFSFRPACKVWMATNHKPRVRGNDDGIWRRLLLLPFSVCIADDEKDRDLPHKLRAELSGILNWALDGCASWLAGGLQVPASVSGATASYRSEQDVIGAFVSACCDVSAEYTVGATALYDCYTSWCKENGEFTVSNRVFAERLAPRGFSKGKLTEKRTMGWKGLRLVDAVQPVTFGVSGSTPF